MKKRKIIIAIIIVIALIIAVSATMYSRLNNKNISQKEYEIIVPEGFKYKLGDKNTGYVITDSTQEDLENGNEFVWIPAMEVTRGLSRYAYQNEEFSDETWNEELPKELIDSVNKYGGFYIARYEMSKDENGNIVSKPMRIPIVNLAITGNKSENENEIESEELNLEKIAKNIYSNESSVESNLVYGAQWDTTLQWLIDTNAVDSEYIYGESSSWGNFLESKFEYNNIENERKTKEIEVAEVLLTGSTDYSKKNNIYDLAGNVLEWTLEKSGQNGYYSLRGGAYNFSGKTASASVRMSHEEYSVHVNMGFRISLYIK